MDTLAPSPPPPGPSAWRRFATGTVSAYHAYGSWLVSISWRRFLVLSVLLVIVAMILETIPPFSWTFTETVQDVRVPAPPRPPAPPSPAEPAQPPKAPEVAQAPAPAEPVVRIEGPAAGASGGQGVDISIDERGIRIRPREADAASAASAASGAASGGGSEGVQISVTPPGDFKVPPIVINLPEGATKEQIEEAVGEARDAVREAIGTAREAAEEARDAARAAAEDARAATQDAMDATDEAVDILTPVHRTRTVHVGDFLSDFAFLWVFASAILKISYKGRVQAEVKAAAAMQTASAAVQTAEAEQLRRQVVEARMAAMQAQVEPHFLFNTLASIDHLIETDPGRASVMQKNLIALLRASMPTMREASDGGVRPLARELAVIRPYLEILKVRMEERLSTEVNVPEGLLSAEFPPMMIQTLVENAIKHGLEPKPDGGSLRVAAEVVHGRLAVTVADTGVGFGRAATAGTGVGLANIRERLDLLYGSKATLAVTENTPQGTVVTITVPYKSIEGATT